MRLQESDSRKVPSVYVLRFTKMGFGTLADNFIALQIIKKGKILLRVSIIRYGKLATLFDRL